MRPVNIAARSVIQQLNLAKCRLSPIQTGFSIFDVCIPVVCLSLPERS